MISSPPFYLISLEFLLSLVGLRTSSLKLNKFIQILTHITFLRLFNILLSWNWKTTQQSLLFCTRVPDLGDDMILQSLFLWLPLRIPQTKLFYFNRHWIKVWGLWPSDEIPHLDFALLLISSEITVKPLKFLFFFNFLICKIDVIIETTLYC